MFLILFTGEESSSNLPEKELGISVDDSSANSSALAEDIKEKLETLLYLLVDTTKGASIEMLERYHSALQCCIHKQRHNHDKKQLMKVGGVSRHSWLFESRLLPIMD